MANKFSYIAESMKPAKQASLTIENIFKDENSK